MSAPLGAGQREIFLLPAVRDDFWAMKAAAKETGIDLVIASGFRDFHRQLAIWNAKAGGQKPCLNDLGESVDLNCLDELQQLFAILRFSALPGSSRHHWGTDMDVFDAAAVPADYDLQLVAAEYESGGPFALLSAWLDDRASEFGFYRPYARDRGGVAPELWHLSHRQAAAPFAAALNPELLAQVLVAEDMLLKEIAINNLQAIFERFVQIA